MTQSGEPRSANILDDVFAGLFARAGERKAKKERECVPDDQRDRFTPVSLSEGFTGVMLAGCNRCGALIYPTTQCLAKHIKFHERVGDAFGTEPTKETL
jgi:hypothetical protein